MQQSYSDHASIIQRSCFNHTAIMLQSYSDHAISMSSQSTEAHHGKAHHHRGSLHTQHPINRIVTACHAAQRIATLPHSIVRWHLGCHAPCESTLLESCCTITACKSIHHRTLPTSTRINRFLAACHAAQRAADLHTQYANQSPPRSLPCSTR